jgi:ABC-type transport system involved in cytochrome bd biosynthesis fused ATPase/permease subunit
VVLYRKKELTLITIRKILWTITFVSAALILFEAGWYMSDSSPDNKQKLWAIYINAPVLFVSIGASLMMQFMDFAGPNQTE